LKLTLSAQDCAAIHLGRRIDVAAGCIQLAAEAMERQRTASGEVDLRGDGQLVAMSGRDWGEYLREYAAEIRQGAVPADQCAAQLPRLIELIKTLELPAGASETGPQRFARDIGIATSHLLRARMILQGLKLYGKLEGDPAPGADVDWAISLVNADSAASDPVALLLNSETEDTEGTQYEPIEPGETRRLRLNMGLPASLSPGQWQSNTVVVSTELDGQRLSTRAYLNTSASETATVALVAQPASARDTIRKLTAEVHNLRRDELDVRVRLILPMGWTSDPEESFLQIAPGQTTACDFSVTIPADAEANEYQIRVRLSGERGRGAERQSEPVNVFCFGQPEFEGWDNLALTATIATDSSYSGYDPLPLNDGVPLPPPDAHWTDAAWASADTTVEHWIEIDLPESRAIGRLVLVWPFDNGELFVSRDFQIQVYDELEADWVGIAQVDANRRSAYTEVTIPGINAQRWRILQPAGGGPQQRPNIMWVGEVGLYAAPEQPAAEE